MKSTIQQCISYGNTVVITFHSKSIPSHVYIGFERFPVATYIDNPLRCFTCQQFGHHSKKCPDNVAKCAKCSATDHNDSRCEVLEQNWKCSNCAGAHPSWSRTCPIYIAEKLICEYKTTHDVSYFEARKVIKNSRPTTYAAAAATDAAAAAAPVVVATRTPENSLMKKFKI